jgi:hypothetical protein
LVSLGAYRVTNGNSAMGLMKMLAKIMAWGATDLKQWVGKNIAT